MGWLFTRQTQSQLIATLVQPRASDNASFEVLEHHLAGDVLWSLVRLTPEKAWRHQLNPGESLVFIRCDLLRSSSDGWGYKALEEACTRITTRACCTTSTWRRSSRLTGGKVSGNGMQTTRKALSSSRWVATKQSG